MKTINPRNCVHRLKISVKKSPNQLPLCIALKKSKFVCSDTPIYIYHEDTQYLFLFYKEYVYLSLLIQNS